MKTNQMPLKLERLVNEFYSGDVEQFVENVKEHAKRLREMQEEVYDRLKKLPTVHDPRENLHDLRKYWREEHVERLELLGNALLDYRPGGRHDSEKELLSAVQKSVVYAKAGDLYALPFEFHLSEAGSAANGAFIARTIGTIFPPFMRFRALLTVLGGMVGYGIAKKPYLVKNPFEELGKKLEDSAERWLTAEHKDSNV